MRKLGRTNETLKVASAYFAKKLAQRYSYALSVAVGTVRGMANFALTLAHGPGWDSARPIREQDGWDEHAAFMDGLVETGFLIVGGPLSNGDRTLHLIAAASETEIRARLSEDPWAAADLLRVESIEPWQLWLDGRDSVVAG